MMPGKVIWLSHFGFTLRSKSDWHHFSHSGCVCIIPGGKFPYVLYVSIEEVFEMKFQLPRHQGSDLSVNTEVYGMWTMPLSLPGSLQQQLQFLTQNNDSQHSLFNLSIEKCAQSSLVRIAMRSKCQGQNIWDKVNISFLTIFLFPLPSLLQLKILA